MRKLILTAIIGLGLSLAAMAHEERAMVAGISPRSISQPVR